MFDIVAITSGLYTCICQYFILTDPLDTRGCSPSTSAPGDAGNDVFFYQAIDGQWVFLHPLNMRMLMHAHKSDPQALPPTLTARIVEREAWVQSEQTRKKLRVLSHIPLAGVGGIYFVAHELLS